MACLGNKQKSISAIQHSIINYHHNVVHQITRTYSSYITEILYPLANIFPFLPSFSPWKSPFYSAFMTVNQISHICRIMQYLSFYVWLISLDIMPSKFIHVVSMSGFSCFPSIMYIYLYPFIHPVDKKFQVRRETEITFFYCYEFFSIC